MMVVIRAWHFRLAPEVVHIRGLPAMIRISGRLPPRQVPQLRAAFYLNALIAGQGHLRRQRRLHRAIRRRQRHRTTSCTVAYSRSIGSILRAADRDIQRIRIRPHRLRAPHNGRNRAALHEFCTFHRGELHLIARRSSHMIRSRYRRCLHQCETAIALRAGVRRRPAASPKKRAYRKPKELFHGGNPTPASHRLPIFF